MYREDDMYEEDDELVGKELSGFTKIVIGIIAVIIFIVISLTLSFYFTGK